MPLTPKDRVIRIVTTYPMTGAPLIEISANVALPNDKVVPFSITQDDLVISSAAGLAYADFVADAMAQFEAKLRIAFALSDQE